MSVISIHDPHLNATASICPEIGFNCFDFQIEVHGSNVKVLDAVDGFSQGGQRPSGSGIPILFPYPNRIRQGQFQWQGQQYHIPGTDKWGNAIHGFCLDRPWRITETTRNAVSAVFQLSVDAPDRMQYWPADFILEASYELINGRLRAQFCVNNPGRDALPWGLGTHPYFRLPLGANSQRGDCTLEVPADRYWELQDCLPTGRILPVDEARDLRGGEYLDVLQLDDVLTDLSVMGPQYDCILIDERAGLQVSQTCAPIFREIVAFTPPNRNAVCIEPYTCVTDAVNLAAKGIDSGWRTLEAGTEFRTWIDISVSEILV